MDDQTLLAIQELVSHFASKWSWLFIVGFAVMMFRSTIESVLESIKMFLGSDFNTDDFVFLDNKPARIVRKGLWNTTFFLYTLNKCGKVIRETKRVIPNEKLKDISIEKVLNKLDFSKYYYNDEEGGE